MFNFLKVLEFNLQDFFSEMRNMKIKLSGNWQTDLSDFFFFSTVIGLILQYCHIEVDLLILTT